MNIVILGISSDIGLALARHWVRDGHHVFGTYRTCSDELAEAEVNFDGVYVCDLMDNQSIDQCVIELETDGVEWDVMVICPGTMEPIGHFNTCDIDSWSDGITVNFVSPMRFLRRCLRFRRKETRIASVIFFAGGGSNSAPLGVSSYTISKIALIKATELLDAEFDDVKFSIVGPGWVRTKIHEETLRSKYVEKTSLEETKRRLRTDDFNSMDNVITCCDWLVHAPKSIVGGRNFSSVHDDWGSESLCEKLSCDDDMYKLRRFGK